MNFKNFLFFALPTLAFAVLSSCQYLSIDAISGSTLVWESGSNNYFNQEASTTLEGPKYIVLDGEVEQERKIKLSKMPLRTVTVREVKYDGTGDSLSFKGTFRYDGYALCDILSSLKVNKDSKEDFWPPVDLYIEVSNDRGDRALFSWGELFYSNNMYGIVIAKRVTRVIPGKTGELWDLPSEMQLVVESDLISERNIPSPTRITVKSLKGNYIVNRDSTVFDNAPSDLFVTGLGKDTVLSAPCQGPASRSNTIAYYGHGMGYKGIRTFSGQILREVIAPYFPAGNYRLLREGLLSVAAVDGYRVSFSVSEIMNRCDQQEPLLMFKDSAFTLFAACDGFADRSVKGLCEIRLINPF